MDVAACSVSWTEESPLRPGILVCIHPNEKRRVVDDALRIQLKDFDCLVAETELS
jgi:hypothetical protein